MFTDRIQWCKYSDLCDYSQQTLHRWEEPNIPVSRDCVTFLLAELGPQPWTTFLRFINVISGNIQQKCLTRDTKELTPIRPYKGCRISTNNLL